LLVTDRTPPKCHQNSATTFRVILFADKQTNAAQNKLLAGSKDAGLHGLV